MIKNCIWWNGNDGENALSLSLNDLVFYKASRAQIKEQFYCRVAYILKHKNHSPSALIY